MQPKHSQVAEVALGAGYRHLDNAAEYGNEGEVDKASYKVLERHSCPESCGNSCDSVPPTRPPVSGALQSFEQNLTACVTGL